MKIEIQTNPQREEYLTTILKFMRTEDKITNKMISERLNLAPSSVTEMLKKLTSEGLVEKGRNNNLTELGQKIAKKILSKHRLWEYFLQEKLHYSWKDVHEHAKKFQTVTNDDLLNKLNDFLGYPEYCPHGSVIYINNEESNKDLIRMSDAKKDSNYIIRRISDNRSLLNYCESIEIKIGEKIKIVDFDSFDETAIIKIGDEIKRISPKACTDIFLKESH